MATERKGVGSIRTIASLVDRRRTRTQAGSFQELAGLATERALLTRELERCRRRQMEIVERLAEIAAKEAELHTVVELSTAGPAVASPPPPPLPRGENFSLRTFEY